MTPLKNPPNPLELSQKVNGGLASISVVPTGLWVCGASIPSDDGVSQINRVIQQVTDHWIPACAGMTGARIVIPAEAGIQFEYDYYPINLWMFISQDLFDMALIYYPINL